MKGNTSHRSGWRQGATWKTDTNTQRLLPGNNLPPPAPEQHTPAHNTLPKRHVQTHTPCTPTILLAHSHTTCHRLTSKDCSKAATASRIKPSPTPLPNSVLLSHTASVGNPPHSRSRLRCVRCTVQGCGHTNVLPLSHPCQAWNLAACVRLEPLPQLYCNCHAHPTDPTCCGCCCWLCMRTVFHIRPKTPTTRHTPWQQHSSLTLTVVRCV